MFDQEFIRTETDYRTDRVRRAWAPRRGQRGRGRAARRWQGPMRGADEMR
ncbi:hypothetical protein [Nocardioides solisilvae]|nr:hypothetical protein [Nocardioides solisilvae]